MVGLHDDVVEVSGTILDAIWRFCTWQPVATRTIARVTSRVGSKPAKQPRSAFQIFDSLELGRKQPANVEGNPMRVWCRVQDPDLVLC
jgi:hypothetical protein